MPGPVSSTRMKAHPFGGSGSRPPLGTPEASSGAASRAAPHTTVTAPPEGVNFTAFESRFTSTCRTRCSSP